jgi:metal-sulfur cluster biosynthetic enzyme
MNQTIATPWSEAADEHHDEHEGTATAVLPEAHAPVEFPSGSVDEEEVRSALRTVIDPEMGLNIVDLGLVYRIKVLGDEVQVRMTLTSPGCPMGPQIVSAAKAAVEALEGVRLARILLVWRPYWTSERINPRVRAYMGL